MVQYSSNLDRVMEARNHFKNRASSKSQTSRGNVLRTVVIILFAVFVMPIILAPSVSVLAQDENCCKGRSIGYIIDKSGKIIGITNTAKKMITTVLKTFPLLV